MKNVKVPILALFCGSLLFVNCSGSIQEPNKENAEISLIYSDVEAASILGEDYANYFDSNVSMIQRVGPGHKLAIKFIDELSLCNFDKSMFDMNTLNRVLLKDSDIVLYSIEYINSDNKILAFVYNEEYFFIKAHNSDNVLSLYTLDDQIFMTYKFNYEADNIISTKPYSNKAMNLFSQRIYDDYSFRTKSGESVATRTMSDCCRRRADWEACIACTEAD